MKNPSIDSRTLEGLPRKEAGGIDFVTQAQILAVTGYSTDWWRERKDGVRCIHGRPIKYYIPAVAYAICNHKRRKTR